jgi:DNA-binding Lrp family transcriptional regulator
MAVQDRETSEAFERAVEQLDEVTECRRMFGRPDYLLFIAVSDATAYEQLLLNKLADLPGVARTNSQLTMKLVKATPATGGTAFGSR